MLNMHSQQISQSTLIIPVNFGLKYRPPKIGLQYQVTPGGATLVHEIPLSSVTARSDPDQVASLLISQNMQFLSPKLVNPA